MILFLIIYTFQMFVLINVFYKKQNKKLLVVFFLKKKDLNTPKYFELSKNLAKKNYTV